MNHEKINEYLTLRRQLDYSSDDALQDALLGKLDYIWWKELDEEDIEFINAEVKRSNDEEARSQQEKTTMNNVFENKEDFLKLRDFWKKFHADGKHKAVPVEYNTGFYDLATKSYIKAYHMVSPLTRDAQLVYLAAMGRSLDKAIGNAKYGTLEEIRVRVKHVGKSYWFKFFGDDIDEKYYDAILERIAAFTTSKGH